MWNYAWDYNDRLTSSGSPTATTTYSYDHGGERVKQVTATTTRTYINKLYNTDGTTKVKHIYANGATVATVESNGGVNTLQYVHTDHLTGSNVVTNTSGQLIEVADYYPFGDTRHDVTYSTFQEQRKFTGHELDTQTSLTYMGARYFPGKQARFLSQDQIAWRAVEEYITDPQKLNMYSYVMNNPLAFIDPDGNKAYIITGFLRPGLVADTQQLTTSITNAGKNNAAPINTAVYETRSLNNAAVVRNVYNDIIADRKANPDEPIVLIGHSRGGKAVIDVANKLNKAHINVNALVQIDSVGVGDNKLPSNVAYGLNFSESDTLFPRGEQTVQGSLNLKVKNTSHQAIDNNSDVINTIANFTANVHNKNQSSTAGLSQRTIDTFIGDNKKSKLIP